MIFGDGWMEDGIARLEFAVELLVTYDHVYIRMRTCTCMPYSCTRECLSLHLDKAGARGFWPCRVASESIVFKEQTPH